MSSNEATIGGESEELVLNVSKLSIFGRQVLSPYIPVQVHSRSKDKLLDASAITYDDRSGKGLVGIEYSDGSGYKYVSIATLQRDTGKTIRIVFEQ